MATWIIVALLVILGVLAIAPNVLSAKTRQRKGGE